MELQFGGPGKGKRNNARRLLSLELKSHKVFQSLAEREKTLQTNQGGFQSKLKIVYKKKRNKFIHFRYGLL